MAGFDIAPYGQAIAEGSKLGQMVIGTVNSILNRVLPAEKMTEAQRAEVTLEAQKAVAAQDWAGVEKEYQDRADARALAAKDISMGNAFTGALAATVRPAWGYWCMAIVTVLVMGKTVHLIEPSPDILDMVKEIVKSVLLFFFGGRTIEKGIALWTSKRPAA